MRRENLPVGGDDKVICKRSWNYSRDKASRQRNSETWWRRTTVMLLGVSFGSYKRRCRDVLMGHHGKVPLRRRLVFHLRYMEMLWRRADGASSLRPFETSPRHTNKTSWRRTTDTSWWRSTETLLSVSFERYLRRRWVHVSTVFFSIFHSISTL